MAETRVEIVDNNAGFSASLRSRSKFASVEHFEELRDGVPVTGKELYMEL